MQKRKIFGCSFPVFIIIAAVLLILLITTALAGPVGSKLLELFGIKISLPSWLAVPIPSPELPPEALFHVGSWPITNTLITAWITIILITLLSYFAFRKPKLVPRGLQLVMETIYGMLLSFCEQVAGEKNGRRFFPVMATIFLFVITNAWLSLIPIWGVAINVSEEGGAHVPLLRSPNTDLNVTLVLAIFAFITIEYFGFKDRKFLPYVSKFVRLRGLKKGFGQLVTGKVKSALGSIFSGVIDVAVGGIELLSEFIRILSFTFRLFGNMIAGEILLLIAAFLVPLVFPVVFYGLEFLVGFIQALIFGGLTLVFMTIAVAHEEEET